MSLRLQLPKRALYVALALATIALGLGVHWLGAPLGPTVQAVLGDALWAAMILWWASAVAPGVSLRVRALVSLALCVGVEVSQLFHSTMLDAVRGTTAGRLVLGSGFDRRDLAAYALGVLIAASVEGAVIARTRRRGAY